MLFVRRPLEMRFCRFRMQGQLSGQGLLQACECRDELIVEAGAATRLRPFMGSTCEYCMSLIMEFWNRWANRRYSPIWLGYPIEAFQSA